MANEKKAPFRANHVGSLLRPPELIAARARRDKGEISAGELRAVEDRCIRAAVKMQEDVGMPGITDGEFRRTLWHADFLREIEGIKVVEGLLSDSAKHFQNPDLDVQRSPTQFIVTGKLRHPHAIEAENFKFLAGLTKHTAKQCIPSPSLAHFRTGRAGIDRVAYPAMEEFFADLAQVYREEIADLAAAGCTYLEIDDVNFAYLCDPKMRDGARNIGEDPDKLPALYADLINACIKDRPANMSVCTHLCRGNFRSSWVAEGGYDPVAEVLFNKLEVDGYFLEFDTPRAGNFAPLRYLPKGKKLILGLVTTKTPQLEDPDHLKRRIDEASQLVPLEQLGISPQCGFSSTVLGNKLTIDDQIAKLELVVRVAQEVWGKVADG
jgi:5-methyltetrahydropteroyltriglutamate--homocysteine methyltransferase